MTEVLTYEALKAERDALADRVKALAVENQAIKAMNDCLSEELRGYESDGAFEGPDMHHLWWKAETPATDAALAAIQAQAKSEAIEQMAIQLEQLPDEALEFLSDVAEFETYQEERHTFVSISNPRAVANAVISLVKEQSTELREAK
ncbi:hypothetical protein I5P68_10450 [Serratia ureilytica]|uniref:hypothetical protein n=1 Tax=Serratia ureilytica TaxID=300181 RepID=UPI0018D6C2F7|nr:hypothetical protein [Serratia ureilytica]MBH2720181.1 hypothetical protein [Serratia ureilytica]